VADGFAVAMNRSNVRGAKGPYFVKGIF